MMLLQADLPVVTILQAGYGVMLASIVWGVATLAWDGRGLRHPANGQDAHARAYVTSLARGVWALVWRVLAAVGSGVALVALAWTMS